MQIEQFVVKSVTIHRTDKYAVCLRLEKAMEIIGQDFEKVTEFLFYLRDPGGREVDCALKVRKQLDGTYTADILRGKDISS